MALIQIDFFSESLCKSVHVNVILPNDNSGGVNGETKTLLLLHGYTGSDKDWLLNSPVNDMAAKYNLAIVMPGGDNSFYLDGTGTGKKYGTYVGKELMEFVTKTFHLSGKREDCFVGGYSMGGFGALHTALAYPETFSNVFALSSALIIHEIKNMKEGSCNAVANYEYYHEVFGELSELENSPNNPEFLIKEHKQKKISIPSIYMSCGTEDFLLEENRAFHGFLEDENIKHVYIESAGEHNWLFWNSYLEPAICWALEKQKKERENNPIT